MHITYQQAKEAAINLAADLGEKVEAIDYISAEYWSIDDYVFVITAGGKFKFEIPGDMIGSGFPR